MQYLCLSFQGFVQQIVYLLSKGFYYFIIVQLPLKKSDKWSQIDRKLIKKYQCELSKDQRYRRRLKHIATFRYLRWHHVAIIMHTNGSIADDITDGDCFKDFRAKGIKLLLPISYSTVFQVFRNFDGTFSAKLEKKCFAGVKAATELSIRAKRPEKALDLFRMIDNYPAWAGVISPKKELRKLIIQKCKQHKLHIDHNKLNYNTYRSQVKVFEDE